MAVPRMRYTHQITIQNNTNSIYSGVVLNSMPPSITQPSDVFKLELIPAGTTTITGVKVVGIVDGVSTIENITCDGTDNAYSENLFNSITGLFSKSFHNGCTININAVDAAYQPIYYKSSYGPYNCTFSTTEGMSAGIQQQPLGLRTIMNHYVRLPYYAPVYKNMEFTITPGYVGKTFVAITDFDVICIPPRFAPVEYAFRATEKQEV